MTDADPVRRALADAHRDDWAFVLAATVRVARDLDLAEESVQEAYAAALGSWARDGVPRNPAAWLTTTARRRASDAIRRDHVLRAKLPLLVEPEEAPMTTSPELEPGPDDIRDERLRLVFTCCHPALAQDAQAALTLRLVCGVPTGDVARLFLVTEPTMAARITRAKRKIATARIPFRIPRGAELPERLHAVLAVVHLVLTTGHTAPSGAGLLRADATARALRLSRMLHELMPDEPEVRGLLALVLATDARRDARTDTAGRPVRLADQDRSRYDRDALLEAARLVTAGLRDSTPGRYVLQAATAVLYAQAPTFAQTDWAAILALYDRLLAVWPSPVVRLNRTIALARVRGAAAGLAEIDALEQDGRLAGYHYLPAVKADLLAESGDHDAAAALYRAARDLAANDAERALLADLIVGAADPSGRATT